MRFFRWLILAVLVIITGVAYAAPRGETFPVCPAEGNWCRFQMAWTIQQLSARTGSLPAGEGTFITQGNHLTFVYHLPDGYDRVTAVYHPKSGDEIPMQRVGDSAWWVLDIQAQMPRGTAIDLRFGIHQSGSGREIINYPVAAWQGTAASAHNTGIDDSLTVYDELPQCPATGILCYVAQTWTLAQLQTELGVLAPGAGRLLSRDGVVTMAYRQSDSGYNRVELLFTNNAPYEAPMSRVENSDWWAISLKLQMPRADEAMLTFGVAEYGPTNAHFANGLAVWRGSKAPLAPRGNRPLKGMQMIVPFKSAELDATRNVYVYLPPNYDPKKVYPVVYMTDGAGLPELAPLVDALITGNEIPPLLMIGTAAAVPTPDNENPRGDEYVPGRNPALFEPHKRFFTQEIREWAEVTYNASTRREDNILLGISNGGLFAAAMSMRHPELYGVILPFSAGASAGDGGVAINKSLIQLPMRVYGVAGTLEPIFHTTTSGFIQAYQQAGAEAKFTERVSGHDSAMWNLEFVNALKWVFAK